MVEELALFNGVSMALRAAEFGHIDAQAKIAIFTMMGNGTEADKERGLAWMLMVDRRGHEMTHQTLTMLYGEDCMEKLGHLKTASDSFYMEYAVPFE